MEEQLPLNFPHKTALNRENLVITPSNEAAYKLIESWPAWPYPVAMIIGPRGSGKTHFATIWQGVSHAFKAHCDNLERAILAATEGEAILLENIDEMPIQETELFHLFNIIKEMHNSNKAVSLLMTAQSAPAQWNVTLKDLLSRMRLLTFAFLQQPDDQLLKAVLIKLFSDKQLLVPLEVIDYSVKRMERSLFMAAQLVDIADKMALIQKRNITKSLINEAFMEIETKES